MEFAEAPRSYQESQTTIKEVNQLSHISLHFDKEEVRFLYFNMNCNYLKVNELLSNIPSQKIKAKIEAFETKNISKSEFIASLNKLIVEKLAEDEKLKKKVKLVIDIKDWKDVLRSSSESLRRMRINDLISICQYLDVYSLYSLSTTEKFFFKLEKNPIIYKHFCALAFKPLPQSDEGVYETLKEDIRRLSPLSMEDLTKATILSNVRQHIWGRDPLAIKTGKKYFGEDSSSYRDTFFHFPRLRFDGYYFCTETYFRKGHADLTGFYVPIHYIKSYRYLRFFDNGTILYVISTRKFAEVDALRILTIEAFEKNRERTEGKMTMFFGEFIVADNRLYIKMPNKTWVNEMEHQLQLGTEIGYSVLQIMEHYMRDLETNAVHQMEKDMREKERVYYFKRIEQFLLDMTCPGLKSLYDYKSE